MGAILRADKAQGEGTIYLIMSLRKAFELDLGPAMVIVDSVNHWTDAEVDAALKEAIASRRS